LYQQLFWIDRHATARSIPRREPLRSNRRMVRPSTETYHSARAESVAVLFRVDFIDTRAIRDWQPCIAGC
jgi:hypothetical protein